MDPVGGAIAFAAEALGLAEGLDQDGAEAVALVPLEGELPLRASDQMGEIDDYRSRSTNRCNYISDSGTYVCDSLRVGGIGGFGVRGRVSGRQSGFWPFLRLLDRPLANGPPGSLWNPRQTGVPEPTTMQSLRRHQEPCC